MPLPRSIVSNSIFSIKVFKEIILFLSICILIFQILNGCMESGNLLFIIYYCRVTFCILVISVLSIRLFYYDL